MSAFRQGLGLIPRALIYSRYFQARVMLGSTEQWSITDGDFNLESLYNMIVRLFEHNPTHPWVLETLAFWNQ